MRTNWMRRRPSPASLAWLAGCLALATGLSGCAPSSPAEFRLNMFAMVEGGVAEPQQQEIANVLGAMFGTPDEPLAPPETGLNLQRVTMAAGPVISDEGGKQLGLYRRHCAHCHGVSGGGDGPTAAFLNPYPRDYRESKFKFKSTLGAAPPTRSDLDRILKEGINGTAMPSFRLLPQDQIDALIEYVIYLSMRGGMERELIAAVDDLEIDDQGVVTEPLDTSREFLVDELLADGVVEKWAAAEEEIVRPDPDAAPPQDRSPEELAASIAAGRELFFGKAANCFTCHGFTALGDGQTTDFDDWNKPVENFLKDHSAADLASLGVLPPRNARPRNLRQGIYRGGRRPLDLFRRLYSGINGTPMPAVPKTLTEEQIWQLVDYVRHLPFEPASEISPEWWHAIQRERPL